MGRAVEYRELKPEALRHVLTTLVERVELDPKTRDFDIKYRLPITGVKGASPRRTAPKPALTFVRKIYLKGFRRRIIGVRVAFD